MEDDHRSFKDWVTEAQRNATVIPSLSVPDTPVANVEIRLVEPTPVPSRVGSLGGSMATSNLLSVGGRVNSWSTWSEEHPTQPAQIPEEKPVKGKFFLPSSPTKSSSEDDSSRADDNSASSKFVPTRRKTSLSLAKRRKQRAKRESESLTKHESSGWEDDIEEKDEDEWSDEPDEPKPKATIPKGKAKEQDEAQKKREMFAKQQIFGKGPSPGLLSGIFRTGGSMVDLVGHETQWPLLIRLPDQSLGRQTRYTPVSHTRQSRFSRTIPRPTIHPPSEQVCRRYASPDWTQRHVT